MIKALIFDLDDTLINNRPLIKNVDIQILKNHGVKNPKIPPEIEKKFFGAKDDYVIKRIVQYFNLDLAPEQYEKERGKLFYDVLDQTKTMPGFKELMKFLREGNYKIALASASPRKYVDKKLLVAGMKNLFEAVITGDDIDKGKPDPEIFLKAAKNIGIRPVHCVVIEDSQNGILAAKAAGMKAIGIDNYPDENQGLLNADIIIDSLSEVEEAVRKLSKE